MSGYMNPIVKDHASAIMDSMFSIFKNKQFRLTFYNITSYGSGYLVYGVKPPLEWGIRTWGPYPEKWGCIQYDGNKLWIRTIRDELEEEPRACYFDLSDPRPVIYCATSESDFERYVPVAINKKSFDAIYEHTRGIIIAQGLTGFKSFTIIIDYHTIKRFWAVDSHQVPYYYSVSGTPMFSRLFGR